jgi:hypothetical protein
MNASQVRDALTRKWPDSEFLNIDEAPEDSSRQGRKIDRLVVSLWSSRGHEIDAVEIKVSLGDWRRELATGAKADFWWAHSHRFWLAVPAEMAEKVQADLPLGWGLLACGLEAPPKVVVRPQRRDAKPLSWPTCVGIMRAAANAGINALQRAEMRGRAAGREVGLREAERAGPDAYLSSQLAALRAQVEAFEEAAGIKIANTWEGGARVGQLVALVEAEIRNPGWAADQLGRGAQALEEQARRCVAEAAKVREAAERVSASLRSAVTP